MTKKRAERLARYEIRSVGENNGKVAFGAFRSDELVIAAWHAVEDLALAALVSEVYKLNSLEVSDSMARAARAAVELGTSRFTTGAIDRGRYALAEDLEPLCWDCHRLIHQRERSM